MNRRLSLTVVVVLGLALLTFLNLVGDWGRLTGGMSNLGVFFRESLWPPDWSVLEPQSYPVCEARFEFTCSVAWLGMVETIKIAFVATVIGFVVALPLSVMAASNLSPFEIAVPTRILLAAMRSLPSIIWAVLFMIIFDMGTLAGICAMSFYTVGYLGKLQFESMEGIKNAPLEAAKAMGMTRTEKAWLVAIPESANQLLSHLLFMFEYNVRHGTVIGLVGAGGIGLYLNTYLKLAQYDKVVALLVVVFLVVVVIDFVSMVLRSAVTEEGDVERPSWSSLFLPAAISSTLHPTPMLKDASLKESE
ncbi:MAG: phosphonate ABC transporter, permease protein PhnE [Euryarchaeota archaeon]|nr:phosphonate ABC transporter, permease protein PhnE [Euryarchaeota archaeon]DAC08864.1 MAG TPA: phosphonate ABC transporter, permease protein PhnE [Candidatus Poseidoniales archaeon]HII20049.1 phosphonate ABC transporter, permease protein PhnE [Poseidonia sp.]